MSEINLSTLLSVADAMAIIDAAPVSPRVVRMPLADAVGLTLAEDVRVDRDWPGFDKSLLDGFAVRSVDLQATLKVIGQITPGERAKLAIAAGETMAIMTGAALPVGADAIVAVEETIEGFDHPGTVTITRPVAAGHGVALRGSDAKSGAPAVARGSVITPAAAAVLASVGALSVSVYTAPRAAVLATGDEIVAADQSPRPEQIRDGNTIMLASLLRNLGCEVKTLGIVRDDPEAIAAALRTGLQSDVLAVTGGMSMGKFDYVPQLLKALGVDIKISKLKIRPGKPFVFGIHRNGDHACYIFGLPGNPLSGYVCMLRLGARLIDRLRGQAPDIHLPTAPLAQPLKVNGPRETYIPAIVNNGVVTALPWNGSADLIALARANVLMVRPENDAARNIGEPVSILLCR